MKVKTRTFLFRMNPLERSYLKIVILAMILPLPVVMGFVYYLVWENVARELAMPELIAKTLFPAFDETNRRLLLILPFILGGMLLYACFLANKLLGPLQRVEHQLEEIARKGDFSKRIVIRKKDNLRPLIRAINRLLFSAQKKSNPS